MSEATRIRLPLLVVFISSVIIPSRPGISLDGVIFFWTSFSKRSNSVVLTNSVHLKRQHQKLICHIVKFCFQLSQVQLGQGWDQGQARLTHLWYRTEPVPSYIAPGVISYCVNLMAPVWFQIQTRTPGSLAQIQLSVPALPLQHVTWLVDYGIWSGKKRN